MSNHWEYELIVEEGKVREFAKCFHVPYSALNSCAPPTWPVVINHWGVEGTELVDELGLTAARVLLVSQSYTYPTGPLIVGQRLSAVVSAVADRTKPSADGGHVRFVDIETKISDSGTNSLVARGIRTVAQLPRDLADFVADPIAVLGADEGAGTDESEGFSVDYGEVSLVDCVRYAGASGDFNQVHFDPAIAISEGFPTNYAQGMLGLGWVGALLASRNPGYYVHQLRGDFTGRVVYPGDTMRLNIGEANSNRETAWRVVSQRQDGTQSKVLAGLATLRPLPPI